jgi:trk system potassium uptake protein TrkH
VKLGGMSVSGAVLAAVTGFCTLYVLSFVAMAMLLAAAGVAPAEAWTAVATCINNMGPGMGAIGPSHNFSVLSDPQTWICTIAMLLGRLEIFSVVVLFIGTFWRK